MHLTRQQVREVDRLAIEQLGIPGIVLMENAARAAAEVVLAVLGDDLAVEPADAKTTVLCGGGNNGGDGYAIARHLHNAGVLVAVYAAVDPDRLTGDAAVNCRIAARMGLAQVPVLSAEDAASHAPAWADSHVIVDALLGTGFHGQVRQPLASTIGHCNVVSGRSGGPKVVAVDVPSGLDCDTGQPANATVRADVTVTFVAAKTGFAAVAARPWLGRVIVADIGAPPSLIEQVT